MRNSALHPVAAATDLGVPDGIPAVVVVVVVEPVGVPLHTRCVDRKLISGPAVVVRVDEDVNPVGLRISIASRQIARRSFPDPDPSRSRSRARSTNRRSPWLRSDRSRESPRSARAARRTSAARPVCQSASAMAPDTTWACAAFAKAVPPGLAVCACATPHASSVAASVSCEVFIQANGANCPCGLWLYAQTRDKGARLAYAPSFSQLFEARKPAIAVAGPPRPGPR